MHIYVDADACPVVDIIEDKARKYKVSVTRCVIPIMYCRLLTVK